MLYKVNNLPFHDIHQDNILFVQGGIKARENIEPREQPVEIPQPVETGVHYARKVSGGNVLLEYD